MTERESYTMCHDIRSSRLVNGITDPLTGTDYKEPPFVAYCIDAYNQTILREMYMTLTASATDFDHVGGVNRKC